MADEALPELADELEGGADLPATTAAGGPQNFIQQIMSDPQKRLYAIIGGAVLAIAIVAMVMMGGGNNENRGKLVPLVQELDQARAFEVVAKLKTVNIEATVVPSERPGEYIVQVYENAVETAYLNLSRTNLLHDEGYGLFDTNDWAASDYDKRIKLTRAINGDLSRIISRMDGLRAAIVRVNIPEQQLFTEFQSPTTASVQIELENDGDELARTQVKSIVNVLRGYVPNLDKDHVSIVDTTGRNYNTFKDEYESSSDDFIEEIERVNKSIKKRIDRYLDEVLGGDKYRVSVSASISRERVQKQQTVYSEGAVGSRQSDKELLNSGAAGNVQGPAVKGGKNYTHDTSMENLYPSYEQQSVTYLPGRITNVSVALAVDKSVPANMSLKQLQESIAAIAGPNVLPEHIKLTVVDLAGGDADLAPLSQPKEKSGGFFFGLFGGGEAASSAAAKAPAPWYIKLFSVIGTILGLLIIGVIGLNFLSASVKQQSQRTVDDNLGDQFDDVLNENAMEDEYEDDYGESKALAQQEELLQEMMGSTPAQQAPEPVAAPAAQAPKSYSDDATNQQLEFDNLLGNFQSAAEEKPDLLAKRIQMWLEDDK